MSIAATSFPPASTAPEHGDELAWNSVLKVFVVLAGYSAAVFSAWTAVYFRQHLTQGPDAQASAGMHAFGDVMLFVAIFGAVALIPTGLGLYFLKSVRAFWTLLGVGVLGLAATGLACAAAIEVAGYLRSAPNWLQMLTCLGVLRMLGAPLLATGFSLCACLAPTRFSRLALLAATALEGLVIIYAAFHWIVVPRLFS